MKKQKVHKYEGLYYLIALLYHFIMIIILGIICIMYTIIDLLTLGYLDKFITKLINKKNEKTSTNRKKHA